VLWNIAANQLAQLIIHLAFVYTLNEETLNAIHWHTFHGSRAYGRIVVQQWHAVDASVSSANLDDVSSLCKVKSFAGIAPPVRLQAQGCCVLPCHLHAYSPAPPCGLNTHCCSYSCCMLPGLLASPDSLHGHSENFLHSKAWICHKFVAKTLVCRCFSLNVDCSCPSPQSCSLASTLNLLSLNIAHADSVDANAAQTAAEMRQCPAAGTAGPSEHQTVVKH